MSSQPYMRLRPRGLFLSMLSAVCAVAVLSFPAGAAAFGTCFGKRVTRSGTSHADRIVGTGRTDIISGGGGNDRLYSGGGYDLLCGDDGADFISGGHEPDVILGGFDNSIDTMHGGAANDYVQGDGKLYGDNGDDALFTNNRGTVHSVLFGGSGNDLLKSYSLTGQRLVGGTGRDRLYGRAGHDLLFGGPNNDRLFGRGGHNVLSGGSGNDVIRSSSRTDHIDCGPGRDTVLYQRGTRLISCEIRHRQG